MNRASWRRHHKWAGIAAAFFLLMFAISGIVLNHRAAVADAGVSRGLLPARYRFKAWNGGLMRGTVKTDSRSGALLVYGAAGIWKTDTACSAVADFNAGLPSGPDHRNIRAVVRGAGGELFAVSIHDQIKPLVLSVRPLIDLSLCSAKNLINDQRYGYNRNGISRWDNSMTEYCFEELNRATYWWMKAAEQNYAYAQENLGKLWLKAIVQTTARHDGASQCVCLFGVSCRYTGVARLTLRHSLCIPATSASAQSINFLLSLFHRC